MTDEERIDEIKVFTDACDKMTASKFIMIDKRVSDVVKSIAKATAVYDLVKECMINFNFDREWKLATAKIGYILPPEESHKFIAFVFSLLNLIDDKKISASDLLSKYFTKTESDAGPYAEFCNTIIVRFKNVILSKLLNNADVDLYEKKSEVQRTMDKDVLARIAFLAKDLKDYVNGLKKVKKSSITKGELIEIINGLYYAAKTGDSKNIKVFVTAIKAGKGKDKEIEYRLLEILDIINKTMIDG